MEKPLKYIEHDRPQSVPYRWTSAFLLRSKLLHSGFSQVCFLNFIKIGNQTLKCTK